jgi:hypothetical protein
MTKKKAIIHIGGHKTGSSAIQAFCVANASRLKTLGITYPLELVSDVDKMGAQAQHGLVNLLMDAKSFWKSFNLRPKSMTDADIKNHLKALPRTENYLFSSENLVWLDKDAIETLKQLLDGFDVHILLYVRRQDDALQAIYQTVVTSIGETKHFDEYTDQVVRSIFEYDRIAALWQSVFGTGKVVVRVYEPSQLHRGDAVQDFFNVLEAILQRQIDISGWERNSGTGAVNRGLPAHITGLIRYHNGLPTKKWIVPFIQKLAARLYKNSLGGYEIIPPSQRREVLESFAESNKCLAIGFLGREDGKLFHDLSINQTDAEWDAKYKRQGSQLWLLLSDIIAFIKSPKQQ